MSRQMSRERVSRDSDTVTFYDNPNAEGAGHTLPLSDEVTALPKAVADVVGSPSPGPPLGLGRCEVNPQQLRQEHCACVPDA